VRKAINTKQAPAAIGPYSQAIQVGSFVFTAGQTAIDPNTGKLVEPDVAVQVRQVMENLRAVLAAAGLTFADVVKTTIFLQDMGDFSTINKIYGEYFTSDPPARSTVQVARLPLGGLVEIEMVAYAGKEGQ
jgi:2-iminobutanoate/2-iminopropanoate deaminase